MGTMTDKVAVVTGAASGLGGREAGEPGDVPRLPSGPP